MVKKKSFVKWLWYTLCNAVRTICRMPPLHKIACAKKIKSVGIRHRCVRVNHTWRSGQFCRFFFLSLCRAVKHRRLRAQPLHGCRSSSQLWRRKRTLPEACSDRTIEDLMERLDKQELRYQQVVDTLQKQVAAAGATPQSGTAPSSSLPTSQPYDRLPSPPPPPKLTPDISLPEFRAWKATWEDYFELSNGPRLTSSHQLALLRTCLSPDMQATLGQTIPARDNLTDQLDEIAGHFRPQRNVALHRVKFEQRHQEQGETFDHFKFTLRYENWLLTRTCAEPVWTIDLQRPSWQGLLRKTYARSC